MRKGNLIWGIIIVLAGVLLLLDNLGILRGVNAWALIWPSALILLGLWFLLGPRLFARNMETRTLSIPVEGARKAEVHFHHGAGELTVAAGSPAQLVSGTFAGGVSEDVRRSGDAAQVKLSAPVEDIFPGGWMAGSRGFAWRVDLSPDVDLNLVVKSGASESRLDLSGLRVSAVRVDTGASSTEITLPARAGFTRLEVHAGAASVDIRVPAGVAARIRSQGGLSSLNVDTARFVRTDSGYQSGDYETAENRAEIILETGVGSVSVR